MEVNVMLELYGMLAKNPDSFHEVLKNLYSREIAALKNVIDSQIENIDVETGSPESRDHYMKEKVDELAESFIALIDIAMYFRKVDMHGSIGADDLIFALQEIQDEIHELADNTGKDVEAFRKMVNDDIEAYRPKAKSKDAKDIKDAKESSLSEDDIQNKFKEIKERVFSALRSIQDELDDLNNRV